MATLADFATLADARAYTTTEGRMIPRTTMNSILGDAGLMIAFEQEALTDDRFAAFMHPTSTEYNFMVGDGTGDRQIAMLDDIISEGKFPTLSQLKPIVLALANRQQQPYANATLYDWQRARGVVIPQKQVSVSGGWIKITLTQDVEPHRPQIYTETLGIKRRIAGFDVVSTAGDYLAYVGGFAYVWVDDAYQVIA